MAWKQISVSDLAPTPRGGHAVAVLGNKLVLFGANATGQGNQAEWTRISCSFPPSVTCTARSGAALVAVGEYFNLFGGQEPNTGLCFHDILKLDPSTWTWSQLQIVGPKPPARHSCVAVPFEDQCVLVFGGAGLNGTLSDVWVFSCLDHSWSSPLITGQTPAAREMAAGVMLSQSKLVVYGGRTSEGKVLDDISVLDTTTWQWSSSSVQVPRCAHTLVAVPVVQQPGESAGESCQQQLLVFGGFSGTGVEGGLWALQQQQHDKQLSEAIASGSSSWSIRQLHAALDAATAGELSASSSSSKVLSPSARFAHAAACLTRPDHPDKQVMLIIGGVNPAEDLMDILYWQQ